MGALAVLGVLGALVLAVLLLTFAGNRVREQESRLAAVKVQERVASEQIARLQAYGTFRQLAADRVSTVRKLAGSRFDWERSLRDLSRAIPRDVTVANITGTVAPGARAGAASSSNPLRASRQAPAIELVGCTRDQRSVARLMARLHAVRGVSRVSLASSTKKKDETSGSSDSAASEGPAGCGSGSPADFELVMFFEAATGTTATPAGDTAAAAASPTPAGTPAAGAGATPAPSSTPAAGATASPTAAGTPVPSGEAPVSQEGTK